MMMKILVLALVQKKKWNKLDTEVNIGKKGGSNPVNELLHTRVYKLCSYTQPPSLLSCAFSDMVNRTLLLLYASHL